jgi:hypothetical protein
MFVLGKALESNEKDLESAETQSMDDQRSAMDIGPTVLFCNPNGGIYEFMYFEVMAIPQANNRPN